MINVYSLVAKQGSSIVDNEDEEMMVMEKAETIVKKKKRQFVADEGTSSFKSEIRSKHSYLNALAQDTPSAVRYRPNFKVSLPSNNYIYSIADENSSGVQPRETVKI